MAVALCVAPALVLALAFSRGAIGAQPTDGDPFRASARMQKILAQPARTADLDVLQSAPAALPQTSPAPPLLHLRGRLQMNEGPLVVLLEIEGVPGLQRLVVGESLAIRSGGVERILRLVDNGTRDPWVSMDGGVPVPLR